MQGVQSCGCAPYNVLLFKDVVPMMWSEIWTYSLRICQQGVSNEGISIRLFNLESPFSLCLHNERFMSHLSFAMLLYLLRYARTKVKSVLLLPSLCRGNSFNH